MEIDPRIDAAAAELAAHPALRALFLAGSHGRGDADAVSDVDLLALAQAGDHDGILAAWRRALETQAPLVLWQARGGAGRLANAITEDWLRIDLHVVSPDRLAGRSRAMLRPLHDPGGLWDALPATLPPAEPDAQTVLRLTREFLRVLGLLPVALARQEWVLAVRGAGLLRDLLVDLMLETSPEPDRGDALHPSRLLSAAQVATLETLPYPGPRRDEVIAAHVATAAAFVPLAQELCARAGATWPAAFEAATRAHLARAGVTLG